MSHGLTEKGGREMMEKKAWTDMDGDKEIGGTFYFLNDIKATVTDGCDWVMFEKMGGKNLAESWVGFMEKSAGRICIGATNGFARITARQGQTIREICEYVMGEELMGL